MPGGVKLGVLSALRLQSNIEGNIIKRAFFSLHMSVLCLCVSVCWDLGTKGEGVVAGKAPLYFIIFGCSVM